MSWEFTVFASVIVLSITALVLFKREPEKEDDSESIWNALNEIIVRLNKLENTHESIAKVAEETKKMLSQENLSRSIRR